MQRLLRSVGLRAEVFASAAEFLRTKLADVPCCLVLDVRLPGLSGLDFQTELAKANIQVPIVFMSGHGDIPMTVKAMKAGAIEFLPKPFRDQAMLGAVRLGLERGRVRREGAAGNADVRAVRKPDPARAAGDGIRHLRPQSRFGAQPGWSRSPSSFIAATSCARWTPSRWPIWCEWRISSGFVRNRDFPPYTKIWFRYFPDVSDS